MKQNETTNRRPVIVSTSQNFCVFGWTEDEPFAPEITLYDSRLVVSWSSETMGLWGLAAAGPAEGSKLSGVCPKASFRDVKFMLEVTPLAASVFAKMKTAK